MFFEGFLWTLYHWTIHFQAQLKKELEALEKRLQEVADNEDWDLAGRNFPVQPNVNIDIMRIALPPSPLPCSKKSYKLFFVGHFSFLLNCFDSCAFSNQHCRNIASFFSGYVSLCIILLFHRTNQRGDHNNQRSADWWLTRLCEHVCCSSIRWLCNCHSSDFCFAVQCMNVAVKFLCYSSRGIWAIQCLYMKFYPFVDCVKINGHRANC